MPTEDIVLSTQRLCLRRFSRRDADLLFELDSDPEVMRFITKGAPTPRSQIQLEILPRILTYYQRTPPQGCWAAHLRGSGQFIGWFHFRADKIAPSEMELGYRLKRFVWGQGLATEGSRAIVAKAFGEWHTEKICARALIENKASQRVMTKAGLKFESEFTYPLEIIPGWTEEERKGVKYVLTQAEFSESNGSGPSA